MEVSIKESVFPVLAVIQISPIQMYYITMYLCFLLDYGNGGLVYQNNLSEALDMTFHGALQAHVPILYTHGKTRSGGILWMDLAHLWVDITYGNDKVETYFMSETPYIITMLCNGPSIELVTSKLLISLPNLPQYFALRYHQSRNSYVNKNEVLSAVDNLKKNNLPLESVWLDANYIDKRRYFSWDPTRFPNPVRLQNQLAAENRSLVVTIGQHFKGEKGYFVHDELSSKRYYIRNPDGSDYVGKCLPGDSSYIDFSNYNAQTYYTTLFSLESFKAKNLHVCLDLNEPTVLENEQYKNILPPESATFEVLIKREERPFIVVRCHSFLESNFGPQIIEDNYASCEHFQI
ncbi:hypothetical protein ILUMI_14173, partial [Ignelater luminosus]